MTKYINTSLVIGIALGLFAVRPVLRKINVNIPNVTS